MTTPPCGHTIVQMQSPSPAPAASSATRIALTFDHRHLAGLAIALVIALGAFLDHTMQPSTPAPGNYYLQIRNDSGVSIYLSVKDPDVFQSLQQQAAHNGLHATVAKGVPAGPNDPSTQMDCFSDPSNGPRTVYVWDDGSAASQAVAQGFCQAAGWS